MGDRVGVVWDPALLGYDLGGDHPFNPVRLELTMRLARGLGVLDGVEFVVPDTAGDADLGRVHRPDYVAAVREAPMASWDVGHGLGTADNPVFDQMHAASALVVGGSLAAARCIADGGVDRAVNLAGGLHHAMPDRAAGFCVYNDCAVAISWLLDNGFDRIAYLDVDVHHGDGVQTVFYDDPRVLTVSLHQHPATLWPGTGSVTELGGPGAQGTSVNIPLAPGTRDAEWLRAFHATVPSLLAAFRPQVLVTQCGVDTHVEDPLADLALSVDGHREIYRTLRDLAGQYAGGKWLVMGGGGYELLRVVPRSWTHLLATVLDRDIPVETALPVDWATSVRKLSPNVVLPSVMGDGVDVAFQRWGGGREQPVDTVIRDVRNAVFPLHGLDPDDPRD
ncbi:acetoin utilization protein AcuC [Actinokineospora globicatena]|uniref:acetoin utilization protein AcuC n=1 Tax=Actinokineospora globicatena TaxID=103729 RepID=UPI0020A45ED9|nr:acetoin utilization protein AcuC [Actinokineospora globicatena]MCP2302612.1 acetoin utilization protein AcuC [Actinokineospora globicatena]GLW75700.1 acetoin utilization protein AcuC [Actinokineospora globicatena]GLW82541.1 acetoin utilization protein AcuC [Actinokineospora globicatena]